MALPAVFLPTSFRPESAAPRLEMFCLKELHCSRVSPLLNFHLIVASVLLRRFKVSAFFRFRFRKVAMTGMFSQIVKNKIK